MTQTQNRHPALKRGSPLHQLKNKRHRDAVWNYLYGPDGIRGNKAESYLAAGYNPKTRKAVNSASQRLFRKDNVRKVVHQLRQQQETVREHQWESWNQLLPYARDLIARTMQGGHDIVRIQFDAAKEIVDRAEGKARQSIAVTGRVALTRVIVQMEEEDEESDS